MVEYEVFFLFCFFCFVFGFSSEIAAEKERGTGQGKIQVSHKYVGSHPDFHLKYIFRTWSHREHALEP